MSMTQAMIDSLAAASKMGVPPKGRCAHWQVGRYHIYVGHAATLYVEAEWYQPECYEDDDLSSGAFHLPPRMGSTRHSFEVTGDSFEVLLQKLQAKEQSLAA